MRIRMWVAAIHTLLSLMAIAMLVPLVYLVCSSIRTTEVMFLSTFFAPGDGLFGVGWSRLTMKHFVKLAAELNIGRFLLNSVFLSSATAVLATLFSAMGGYALAKFEFRWRAAITNVALV